ncbi:hypothetical protein M378DRAFT_11267 [Amanita muscaria Koide BX008]|uniref:Uncharacterized protein n=1 Tax=Amanita muscaria (strain Koide BX008) TaxID=946122 RepID=A0A0C2X5Z7_AMAMK|nr:hypothetical protein M378DRAFT_11267 [Amanita muscaria Koide BX008]
MLQFAIIFLISSFLVPALCADPPPAHGSIVKYQGVSAIASSTTQTNGPHHALVVGSQPDREGKHNLAPFAPDRNPRPGQIAVHPDKIVKAHPDNIVRTQKRPRPKLASAVENYQKNNPQSVSISHASTPVVGAKNYRPGHMLSSSGGPRHGGGYRSS